MDIEALWLLHIMHFVGLPYKWGGKDPQKGGLDCSGFVQVCLDFMGIDPMGEHNAQSLYDVFINHGLQVTVPWFGDLLFFGTKGKIHHVAIALSNEEMVEAAHGNSKILTPLDAFNKGARVMINPISHMKDLFAVIRPAGYPWVDDGVSSLSSKVPANRVRRQGSSQGSSTEVAPDQTPYCEPGTPRLVSSDPKNADLSHQSVLSGVELAYQEKVSQNVSTTSQQSSN